MSKYYWWGLVVFLVSLDQWTKAWALQQGWGQFNQGISWGVGQAWVQANEGVLKIIILVLIVVSSIMLKKAAWSALFLAGAVGNCIDRWRWGAVYDWISVPPIGGVQALAFSNNLADWYIAMAVIGLIVVSITSSRTNTLK